VSSSYRRASPRKVNPSLDVTATAEVVWASPAVDLSGFLGSGALDFVVNAAADQFAGGAVSYVFGANQFASATVTITYVYGEDDDGGGGGGGGGGGTGATLGNRVWLDTDEDGLQGDPVLEPGIAGATVDLLNGGVIVATVTTGADGSYGFTGLAAGSYVLRVTPPAGSNWVASADPDGVLTPGEALVAVTTDAVVTDADFGFAVLALDPYTVANDPNRRIQREWTDRLEDYNRGETDGDEDDCD
jgi:SdrD B-like domain